MLKTGEAASEASDMTEISGVTDVSGRSEEFLNGLSRK
jgi:hypothetical protein